jgi:hypothetical protein
LQILLIKVKHLSILDMTDIEPNNQQLTDEEVFKNFQNSVHLGEGKAPHVFVVLGASVRVL